MSGPEHYSFGEKYFKWSRSNPPPEIWLKVENPAMTSGINEAMLYLPQTSVEDARVLDVGVGGAKVVDLLLQSGFSPKNITGIDISPTIISLAKKLGQGANYCVADITNPKITKKLSQEAPFDLITCSMVFNHLTDSQLIFALSNIFNLLVDRGSLVALVPYPKKSKRSDLIDANDGYVLCNDIAPWGDIVQYHHRNFAQYFETIEMSGFIPHFQSFCRPNSPVETTNRLLIVARKDVQFKNSLINHNLGPELINRHNYSR